MSTPITYTGNATADPELRFTQNGKAVASFRVAHTPRRYNEQKNDWVDGETVYLSVVAFGAAADGVARNVFKGSAVVVVGSLEADNYTTKEGEARTGYKIKADNVALDTRWLNKDKDTTQAEPDYQTAETPF